LSGTFGDADTILNLAVDVTTALSGGGAGNITVFAADDDTITIGDAAKFEELEIILDTGASGAGIAPTYEYSTGVGTWATFGPVDGTNAFKNTGVIVWTDGDLSGWAVGTGSEYLIRITRTRNFLATVPIIDKVQISAATEYSWNKNGLVSIADLTLEDGGLITLRADDSHILASANGLIDIKPGNALGARVAGASLLLGPGDGTNQVIGMLAPGSGAAGDLAVRGGAADLGAGGDLNLQGGDGSSSDGVVNVKSANGASTYLTVNPTTLDGQSVLRLTNFAGKYGTYTGGWNTTNTATNRLQYTPGIAIHGSNYGIRMEKAGSVIALSMVVDVNAISGSTIEAGMYKNGSTWAGPTAAVSSPVVADGQEAGATFAVGTHTFAAGDTLWVRRFCTGGTRTTDDTSITFIVEFDD
jgi:hypothetical protein